jgi:hypothetical protein
MNRRPHMAKKVKKHPQKAPKPPCNAKHTSTDAAPDTGPPQGGGGTFSRWAKFEEAVLAKVEDPEKCKKVIALRQAQIDDDANEADLVAAYLRAQLREQKEDPETCCVFMTTPEITKWLQDAIGSKLPINKATPYLRTLAIPELRYSKKDGVPGWVWRGRKAPVGATAKVFSKLPFDPRRADR